MTKKSEEKDHRLPIPTLTGVEGSEQAVKNPQIRISKVNWSLRYELLFLAQHPINDAPLVGEIRYKHVPVIGQSYDPSMIIQFRHIQRVMDELWNAGLRPSEEIGYPGELQATQLHLSDTRQMNKQLLDTVLKHANSS